MNSYDPTSTRRPSRVPQDIATELLSLRLGKPEDKWPSYGDHLEFELSEIARNDDIMDTLRRYSMANADEQISNFMAALAKLKDGHDLDAVDRNAIRNGLEVNTALIDSSKYIQTQSLADIHPEAGSEAKARQDYLFELFRPDEQEDARVRAQFDESFRSVASEGYYLEKALEKALTEKAAPLIVELAASLNIPLKGKGHQRG